MKSHANHLRAWITSHAGTCIVLFFLAVHLIIINDYGFTWDFHFHFFGGGKLLGIEPSALEPRNLPFVEPDPRNAWTLPYGAVMSIPPVASYLWLSQLHHILPPDSAYHLPIILWGVLGIAVTFLFVREAVNRKAAVYAAFFIALIPRYFGDLHNNMKDIPSAVVFAINMWALWRLMRHKRVIDLVMAVLAFAVAFNVKINSIFIPAVFLIFLIVQGLTQNPLSLIRFRFGGWNDKKLWLYFFLAPIAAFLLWWVFWPNPIGQLGHAFMTFGIGTNNIEVLLHGSWYCSGSTVPWYYPFWYLIITTPIPLLILFGIGTATVAYTGVMTWKKRVHAPEYPFYILLVTWLFLPLTRYFIPTIGVIDGIRHFEEVLFPIAILAAIGLHQLIKMTKCTLISSFVFMLTLILLCNAVYTYHPYQITYFNELVGGARGAFGRYDLDYWGTSQKEAVQWVNAHAPQNATVHIVMAAAVAGQYLRPDLLAHLNSRGYDESDYVILLNRQSFLYRFFYAYEYNLHHTPIHTITAAGAPLTWIYDNRTDNKTPRQTPWWKNEDPCIIRYWKGETTYWK